ncbi:hypothetical protein [Comamonas sp. JC664]|uniref:hypothetical protein n=1 Tax=Comamonas sp. JC664 TaxID=2801917 RepID=UPI00174A1F12|nr:hypothetical protein [Comamonas sp. JC664]MBL0697702.1 hypothetical protein [Comamonas sp. JC664]GHG69100.1 hypothetical protein GCM10012319_12950 [Comamonas sp. KCTC 72670]
MPDAPRIQPPSPRTLEGEDAAPRTDVSPWMPPDDDAPTLPPTGGLARRRGKPTPHLDLPLPVLVLIEQARGADVALRPGVAERLNLQLARMAQSGGDRLVADTFLRLLESGRLSGLVDSQGRSCRAAAVEALLSLGFPYALEVRPEDLEHQRANVLAQQKKGQVRPYASLAVAVGGLWVQWLYEALRPSKDAGLLTSQVGLMLLAMAALWLAPPRTPVYRVGMLLLALVSLVGVALPLLAGAPLGVWAGVAGLVAAFLAALREG